MNRLHALNYIGRAARLSVFLVMLAGCGSAEPELVLPTPSISNESITATAIAIEPTPLPTLVPIVYPTLVVPTAVAPTTVAPTTVAPTPIPIATAATAATAVPSPSPTQPSAAALPIITASTGYQVAFVAGNDVLNIRSGPGANYPVVGELAPVAAGIGVVPTGQTLTAGSTWVLVETGGVEGWVNSRYLTESLDAAAFCSDPAVERLVDDLHRAIKAEDGRLLASLVHPERGLRLRTAWWNDEVTVYGADVADLFGSRVVYDWGTNEGSGLPIRGTFAEIILPRLERDLLPASETACDGFLQGPTAGMIILPEGYQQVHFLSLYRPAPAEMEFDWGMWAVGVERWEGRYYLSYLVHYRYEI